MTLPRRSVQLCIVVALAVAAFVGSLGGELVSDDSSLIGVESGDLASSVLGKFWHVRGEADAGGIYGNVYRPLTQLMFALEKRAFGAEPAPFHLVNLLLHACNSVLALRWLSRRLRGAGDRLSPAGELAALLGATLFAVHPAHAESVAWISGATDLLMTLQLLLAFELLELGRVGRGFALIAFACAVFSKEPAAVAPALCLVDAWARRLPMKRAIGDALIATIGVGVASAVVLWIGFAGPGAAPPQIDLTHALAITGHYVRIALAPSHLTFQALPYAVDAHGIHVEPVAVAAGAATSALLLALFIFALRDERARAWCADGAWFGLLLLPVVLLLQSMISDRFLYAPLLGLCALCARALTEALAAARGVRYAAIAASCGLIALAVPRSAAASKAFLDDEALWRSQLRLYPDNPKALDALAEALTAQNAYDEARGYFEHGLLKAYAIDQRAVALHFAAHLIALPALARPEWDTAALAQTRHGCEALFERHRAEYARGVVHVAFDVAPSDLYPLAASPSLLLVPCTRALLSLQALPQAVRMARRAVEIAPDDAAASEIYALSLARSGAYTQALEYAQRALALRSSPQLADLVSRIRAANRIASAQVAVEDARGRALVAFQTAMTLGSPHAARSAIVPALQTAPGDHELVHALVQSYVTERRFELAQSAIDNAERAAPGDATWPEMSQALAAAEAALRAEQAAAQGASAKQ